MEHVTGNVLIIVGVGEGTCANLFKIKGLNAYVWQCGGGTLHISNEHLVMKNMITNLKIFTTYTTTYV